MSKLKIPGSVYAGMLLGTVLLASTPSFAQEVVQSPEAPKSIISLASAPKPQGEVLARNPGDATFEHAPANYHVFATASAGRDAGVEALTLNFAAATKLTRIESKNKDFVIESGGTCHEGNSYSRGDSCSLLVRFNPQGPGHRLGFINVSHSAEAKPMSFGLTGNGYSPVVSFTPSLITTVPSSVSGGAGTIKSSTNLAIDGGDILYIADTGNSKLKEMDSSGVITPTILSPIATPASLAADSFGIVYTANTHGSTYYFSIYYPWGSQTAYGYAYTSSTCTPSVPCAFATVGMNYPANMSIDNYNNLIFEEGTTGAAEMPVASISGGSGSLNLWHLSDQFSYSSGSPASFAVDTNGNLYTKYNFSSTTCYILEESLYNAEYSPTANRVAGGTTCGFTGDGGQARSAEISSNIGQIAFDVAGNLYFADTGNQRIRRIDASTGIINTVAGSGIQGTGGDSTGATQANLSNPTGVAVDSQGQIYILSNAPTAGPTQEVRMVTAAGAWSYNSRLKGTISAAKVFQVANTGNSALILSSVPFFAGNNPGDFGIDSSTTDCVFTPGATLAAGRSCHVGIVFKPSAGGSRSAQLVFQDNSVTGANRINLMGIGLLPPTMSITSPTGGSSVASGATVTFSVSVTSTSSPKPTGQVTFSVNGTTIGSPVTLNSSGVASTTFTESSASTYTLSAAYNGDSNYAATTVSESLIVTAVKVPVQVSLAPAVNPLSACGRVSLLAQVASASGGGPTGTVQLKSGTSTLTSATLSGGAATLSASGLAPGSHAFIASYGGDSLHDPATSAPVSVTIAPSGISCVGGHTPSVGVATHNIR
jgi:Bacterial Ig-like domain (group 3)